MNSREIQKNSFQAIPDNLKYTDNQYFSRPGGNRTLDPMIKSHVLCQLSYGPVLAAN